MKKILRAITIRYMIIFMMLIILAVAVLGAMIASILSSYSVDMKMEELSTANILFKAYYTDADSEIGVEQSLKVTDAELQKVLHVTFLTSEGNELLIADKNGILVMHACKTPKEKDPTITYKDSIEKDVKLLNSTKLPKRIIDSINTDGDLSMSNTCGGMFDEKVIWFASALKGADGEPRGYIVSYTNAGGEGDLFMEMLESISLTTMWLLVVMMVAIYVISYKVTMPLREMSSAAKSFARGSFDVRVPERGNDEITDLARSFNKMAVELQAKDDMQKQFLSSASHDLRTPMTTIAGFIDGILDGAIPSEKQEHYLKIIKSEVKRLSRLVSSLLDISRLQSGDRKFENKPFNICEMARQTIISFENQFNEKELDVEFDSEEYDILALGDKDAINQVVYNLCHNAIKFSYKGSKYRVRICYTEDNTVKFSVYNEGIGISKEELPFVFDRFYKSDKSRGLDKTGVGLGLFISKTIIDAHKGDMTVNSEYEKWCEFSFTLPKGEKD